MILECTECRTRYVVPDAAIGVDGRTVRCASCKHSWFQAGAPVLDLVAQAEAPGAMPAETETGATVPPVTPRAPASHDAAMAVPPGTLPDYDPFAHQPPFKPRRNPARRWTIAALAAGVAMLAGAAGISYSGAPGMARGLFRSAETTPLRIVNKPIDQHVFNGNDIFAISGTVLNPTDSRQPVPDIRADLLDAHNRIVFSWIIRPDAMVLPPRGQVQFDSARVDVPVSAKVLKLGFSGESAR